eukprot:13027608-Ditylum_brightwellii.AAC.1
MFGGNAEMHTAERCNKKSLLSSVLDGYKKKRYDRAKKEEFHTMQKLSKSQVVRAKKLARGDDSLTKLADNNN